MSKVFWDTNLFIYLLEDFDGLSAQVSALREHMVARHDQLYTSALTLGEVLVKPLEARDLELQATYLRLLTEGTVLIPFDRGAAVRYAALRADRSIRPPDGMQLACAAQAGIDLFITNDDRLSHKIVPGIQFLTSLQRAFL